MVEGACIHEKKEITDDFHRFFRQVGLINDYREIEWLGFCLDNVIGLFAPEKLPDLREFCRHNEEYHIVSMLPECRYENCFVRDAKCYFLADGDKNPLLTLQPFLNKSMDLIQEEILEKAFAMRHKIDRGHKT